MYEISKTFEFSAAHSVHSQKLNKNWAKTTYPKCRRLPGHGHNYKLTVYLVSKELDSSQMVTDFGHLWWLKSFIDNFLDHKLILGTDDPAFKILLEKLGLFNKNVLTLPNEIKEVEIAYVNKDFKLTVKKFSPIPLQELSQLEFFTFSKVMSKENSPLADFYSRLLEGLAFINCSPTSENLSRFFYHFIKETVKPLNITCKKVTIKETESSTATFTEDEG